MLVACSTAGSSSEPVSLDQASQALKVSQTQALHIEATGRWFQFGQAPAPGLPWPAFDVSRYSADIDYAAPAARVQITRQQVIEAGRERPAPADQSVDQYVAGTQAWNRGTAAATTQPAALAERRAEIWSTPQGFVKAAQAHQARTRATGDGTEVSFDVDAKTHYVGWLNARGEVSRVQTWVDTPVLGDTLVETRFEAYQDFGGVPFPSRIVRSQGGHPVLELKVAQVQAALGAGTSLAVPAEVASARPASVTVSSSKLADGVYYLTGGTHHSVLIEQRDHLVIVEAPLNEERSLAVIAKARERAPGKPIKYLVNTHAHFDHSGGLRTFADAGATIVTNAANRPFYEQAWAAPRSINPDQLALSRKTPRFETFTGKHVLSDGQRTIEIHDIAGNGHNDAFSLVYLPAEKVLVEADAYTPPAANAPAPTSRNPYTTNLYQNVLRLKLDVTQIAALHGPRVVNLAELRSAAEVANTALR
ncbi:MBL fold metallo-hydrolase [Albitalea terrae]|uniref:MBL fold metallo-hydrolase n=2 Tax=Piscinibacter terrae TaxID=2496871 RepID=A0A3N7HL08_9BURK|nr:MBL fold metallo-hydrolase [Albitalea terrae]